MIFKQILDCVEKCDDCILFKSKCHRISGKATKCRNFLTEKPIALIRNQDRFQIFRSNRFEDKIGFEVVQYFDRAIQLIKYLIDEENELDPNNITLQ